MPRLPGPDDLGPLPSGQSKAPIARFDTTAVGEGMSAAGSDLTVIGANIQAGWDKHEEIATESRFQEWKIEESRRFDEATRNMQPGQAKGFAASYIGERGEEGGTEGWSGYSARAQEFARSIPERLRPQYSYKLTTVEDGVHSGALNFERAEQKRASLASLDDSVQKAFLPKATMAATLPPGDMSKSSLLAEAEAEANSAIDAQIAAGNLTPIEAETQRKQVRKLIQDGFARNLSAEERILLGPNGARTKITERIRYLESGGNPDAKNPLSSAEGPDQFIKGTWLEMVRKYRPDLAGGRSDAEILDLRRDPNLSGEMTQLYAEQNAKLLKAEGFEATPGALYMSHLLGPRGAVNMLQADPNLAAASVNPEAAKANPYIFYHKGPDGKPDLSKPKSVGDVRQSIDQSMSGTLSENWATRLDALDPATKAAYAADGAAASVKDAAARKQAETALYNQRLNEAENAILNGTFGLADVMAAYDNGNGWLKDGGDRRKLIEQIEKRDKEGLDLAKATALITNPENRINPFAKEHREATDLYYKHALRNGAGLLDGDAGAALGLRSVVKRTEIVPSVAVGELRGGMRSRDPKTLSTAYSIVDGLRRESPAAFARAGFSKEDLDLIDDYQQLSPVLPAAELSEMLNPNMNPQEKKRRAELFKEGEEKAREYTKDVSNLIDEAFDTWLSWEPDKPGDAGSVLELKRDFETLYAERHATTGQADVAKAQAMERLKMKWGETNVGPSDRVMAYPPERYYPTIDNSHDWMDEQFDEEVRAEVKDAADFWLVKTPETEAVVARNKATGRADPVPYGVWYADKSGVFHVMTRKDSGNPALMVFDPTKFVEKKRAEFEEKRKAITTKALEGEQTKWKRLLSKDMDKRFPGTSPEQFNDRFGSGSGPTIGGQ